VPEPEADVVGWSLLLPPGWWHVPLDGRRTRSVRALTDRLLADRSRDAVAALRRALVAELDAAVERAVRAGAQDLYLLSSLSHGLPVAATCLATVLDRALPDDVPAGVVAELLSTQPGDVPGVVVVEGREVPSVRRADPGTGVVPDTTTDTTTDTDRLVAALPSARLDVHVPFPDRPGLLLLSFSTTVPGPVQPAMTALFEAVAGSLRWTRPPEG
jgi:hypothetical protein